MPQQNHSTITTSTFLLGLPEELKLQIARHITTPHTPRHSMSRGFPNIPDLDVTLRAVNREASQLFSDIVSKDYLHIQILACRCALHTFNPFFSQLAEQFHRNRRVPDISVYEKTLRLNLSVLEIEIMCNGHCVRRQAQMKTFLVTPGTMLTLYGILQGLLPDLWIVRIESRCNNPRTNAQAIRVLNEMRRILHETRIAINSKLLKGYNLGSFCTDLSRQLSTPRDMLFLFESHLYAIQDALDDGIPLEQLVSSLILYEHGTNRIDVFEPIALWDIKNWKKARRYLFEFEMTYDCAVLQGIASYLLSRKLTHEEQSHFFMKPGTIWIGELWHVLSEVDRSVRYYQEFQIDVPDSIPVTMGWMAPIYKARVEFLLAWARLNTLAKFSISGFQYPGAPPIDDIEYLGDNQDEEFDFSTWGTPKSIVLVARRDMKRLSNWIDAAVTNSEAKEGVHPMDIEANMAWMWKMRELADAIDDAQRKKGYDPTMGRILLQDEMIEESLCTKLYYLPDAERRKELHREFEEEDWET